MKLRYYPMLLLLAGCASFHSIQTETETNGSTRRTDVKSWTLFDSSSELTKLRGSTTDRSQSITIGSLGQEATATNFVTVISAIAEGFARGMKNQQ